MILKKLISKLEQAQGRSEFVIAVVCDIRGFSSFSTEHESPDTAMFIKRFYIHLLQNYFKDAVFAKTTGDGLLMTFRYTEDNLGSVAKNVVLNCLAALRDYPKLFKDDPMINYEIPEAIGFGISRGTACCLYAKKEILDYSGQLLNLTSRLNDFARPSGLVIDGAFLKTIIPDEVKAEFRDELVYVRGVSERKPITVFCSTEVKLPSHALHPIIEDNWKKITREMTYKQLKQISDSSYSITLPNDVISTNKIKLLMEWPNPNAKKFKSWKEITSTIIDKDASGQSIKVSVEQCLRVLKPIKVKETSTITFSVHYISNEIKQS